MGFFVDNMAVDVTLEMVASAEGFVAGHAHVPAFHNGVRMDALHVPDGGLVPLHLLLTPGAGEHVLGDPDLALVHLGFNLRFGGVIVRILCS